MSRNRTVFILRGVIGVLLLLLIWWVLPILLLQADSRASALKPKEYFDVLNAMRGTIVGAIAQVVTVPLGIGALYVTLRQLATSREQADKTNRSTLEQLEIARRAQLAERFTRAVDQLGHDKDDVRIGGIYALGQILKEQETGNYHGPIIEILTAYLREHHPWPVQPIIHKKMHLFGGICKNLYWAKTCCTRARARGPHAYPLGTHTPRSAVPAAGT